MTGPADRPGGPSAGAPSSSVTSATIAERLEIVRGRIASAGGQDVALLAVTKGFPPELIPMAIAAGCDRLGENYVQELVAKQDALRDASPRPEVHLIGQLQTNKVRAIARLEGLVGVVETVDRVSLVDELGRRCPGQRVLVQVDTSGEPGKGGCRPEEVPRMVDRAVDAGLCVEGLMTVGPTSADPAATRAGFRLVRGLVDRLGFVTCSMGMSADLEIAVAEGSTQVRIGSALFGPRPPRR